MTMMVQSRASNRIGQKSALAIGVLLLVLIFGTPLKSAVRGFFAEFIFPQVSDERFSGLSKSELAARLTETEDELIRIKYQGILYELALQENNELKSAGSLESFSKAIPARVLVRPPRTLYDTLLLDRGVESGIKEDDLVVAHGVMLGKIISVDGPSSTVELFSTSGVTHDVILGEPRAVAIAEGMGGGSFTLSIPRSVTVLENEPVRIPNSETLILGVVVSVKSEATDSAQKVLIRSLLSLSELDYVTVIPQSP